MEKCLDFGISPSIAVGVSKLFTQLFKKLQLPVFRMACVWLINAYVYITSSSYCAGLDPSLK